MTVADEEGFPVFNHFAFPSFDSMDVPFLTPETDYVITVNAILIDDAQVASTIPHQTQRPSSIHINTLESDDKSLSLRFVFQRS